MRKCQPGRAGAHPYRTPLGEASRFALFGTEQAETVHLPRRRACAFPAHADVPARTRGSASLPGNFGFVDRLPLNLIRYLG